MIHADTMSDVSYCCLIKVRFSTALIHFLWFVSVSGSFVFSAVTARRAWIAFGAPTSSSGSPNSRMIGTAAFHLCPGLNHRVCLCVSASVRLVLHIHASFEGVKKT